MNLDELKIKVSIELEDFNKQLNTITKGIEKAFGPKAMKKMMQANHKIIKTESAAINKELNKAFEVDFKKFNTNLKDSMNQAKQIVRQTCREIRSELNAALNVRGSVRVTGKASVSNSYSSRGSSDSSAIIQSSQYTGAMINKAVNEMIKANNANTARIETAIKGLAGKLDKMDSNNKKQNIPANPRGNATHKQNIEANAIIETSFRVIDDELQSYVDKAVNAIKVPKLEAQLAVIDSDVQNAVDQVVRGVQIPEIYASLGLLDSGVQDEINDIVSSVNIPEIIINVAAEDNDIQDEVDSIADSVNVPELAVQLTVEDDDMQSEVDRIVESIDVPELNVELGLVDNDIQNEVNKTIREVSVPELISSFVVKQEELQLKVNNALEGISLVSIPVSFDIDKTNLQSKLNSVVSELRIPEIKVPIAVAKPKTKKANEASKKSTNKAVKQGPVVEKTDETVIDVPVKVSGEEKIYTIKDRLIEIGRQCKELKKQFQEAFSSNIGIDEQKAKLVAVQKELDKIINKSSNQAILNAGYNSEDSKTSNAASTIKSSLLTLHQKVEDALENIKRMGDEISITIDDDGSIAEIVKKFKDASDELSITIDDDDIFGEMSEVVDQEINEIKNKLKDLSMMYSSLFNRTVISDSLKYDLNIANKALAETHNNIKALKTFIDSLSGSTAPDIGALDEAKMQNNTPSLMIDDNESFSDFGNKLNTEIDSIEKNLQHLNMLYNSLFANEYLGTAFEHSADIANGSLEEIIETIGQLKTSMQSLPEYAGFQNKFEASESAGLPIVASDALNEQFDSIRNDIDDAHKKIVDFNKAISDLFDYLNMPIEMKFYKSISEVEELKSAITNLLSMNQFGPGLEGFKKQIEADSKEIEDAIEKIYTALKGPDAFKSGAAKEVEALYEAIKQLSGTMPGIDLGTMKDEPSETEPEKAPKETKEKPAKPTKPDDLLALEKEIKAIKEELIDIKDMTAEEFEMNFDLDESKKELAVLKQQFVDARELFKEFNNNNELQFNLKPVRDCISLVEKLKAKIDKIEASKIELEVQEPETQPLDSEGLGINEVRAALDTLYKEVNDTLRALDFADEIELNLGIDQLTEQLRNLQSVGDIDINLDDLRRDIVLLLENIDRIRSESEDEIVIQVVDEEVAKIVELLKLLDDIREQYKIKVDVDTSDATQAIEELQDDIRNKLKTPSGVGSGLFSSTPGGPTGGSGGGNGGGGRRVDSGSFTTPPPRPEPSFNTEDTGMDFNAHVRDFNMGKIIDKFKELANKIKPIMKDLSNKIKDSLKGALSKLASASKTMWSKITGIFKKGAKDSAKATNSLRDTIKGLAGQFLSFYTLWNGAKMAIQSAEGLMQGEQKLTTVMKNRMKATDDSVRAIRKLIDAQSQLGVVSKQVQYNASQQLSVFLQSSKALETLIPSMNDLIAQQYGANATLEEGAEVARKLGQAIVEGEFTELQESTGITLSEAEIEKFRSLTTEEERAAYLAQILSDRIGNMNEQLANTPYGAITQLKNNFMELLGTVGALIVTAIKPLVQWLNQIVIACTKAIKAFGEFLGFSFDATSLGITGGGSVGEGVEDTKEELEDATEAAEKFKGSLMGFDELNILTDNTNKDESKAPTTDGSIAGGGEAFADDEGALDIMSDKMKAFLDEVLEPFKKAWDLLGDRWKTAWADLKESFKNFCDSLATFLKSVWENGGKEFVQHLAEIGIACGIAAMEIGGTILDSLAKLWQHLDPETNMNTQGFIDALNIVSVKLRDLILSLNGFFESLMNNGGQEALNAFGDMLMNLGEAAVRGAGVAIDAISGLLTHLDASTNENTVNLLGAWTEMFGAIGQAALDFVALLESTLVNGGQEVLNAFADMVLNLAQSVSEIITTIMTAFSGLFEHLDPATNQITQNMLTYWKNAFTAVGEAALGFSELLDSVLVNGGQDVLNALGDAFNSLVGLAGKVVEEVANALTGLYEHLDPKTNTFTQNMLKAWQTAFENISDLCATLGETLSSIMDNGGQALLNALGDLAMEISEFFATIVGEAAECMGEFAEHIDPSKNKVTAGALDAFKYFIDSIRNFIDMLGKALGTFMDNGGQEFVNNLGDIIALVGDLAFTIGGDIINTITTFMNSWAGQMLIEGCARALEVISEVLEGLLRILEPLSPIISGVVTAIGGFMIASKVVGFIQGIVTVFQTLAGSGGILALAKTGFTVLWGIIAANPIAATVAAIAGIIAILVALYNKCEWFRDAVNKVFERIKEPVQKLMDTFSDLLENVTDIFGNIIDIIVGIFEGDGYKVGEAVRNMIGNVIDIFKGLWNLRQDMVEIGLNLILGLVEGIWECIKNIPQLLAGLGEFVVDFFKGLFGIHSPSTVFKELGINLIEGLIEGITSMLGAIGEAFTNIKDAVVGWVQDIVGGAIEKWSELKGNIVDNLSKLYDEATEKWKDIYDSVSGKCKEIYEDTKEKWGNVKKEVSDRCKDIYEDTKKKWGDTFKEVSDKCKNIYDDTKKKWGDIKKELSDRCKDIYEDTKKKWDDTKKDVAEKCKNIYDDTKEKWTNVKNTTGELVDKLKSETEEKYGKFRDNLTGFMDNWRSNSESKWDAVKNKTNELSTKLKDEVEERYGKFRDNLTGFMDEWRGNNEGKWDEIKSKTTSFVDTIKGNAEKKYGQFRDNLTKTLDEWRSNSEGKWDEVKSKTFDLVNKLRSDAEGLYLTMQYNLGTVLDNVKTEAGTKWENIKSTTNGIVEKVVSEASNIFGNIKGGLTGKLDDAKAALEPKWETLKSTAKTKAEGMVSSAKSGFSGLSRALTDVIDDAKDAASRAWQGVKDAFSKFEFKMPTIKLPKLKIEWATLGSDSSWFPSIKYPKFSWYARGGIIDGITPLGFANGSMHMAGEAGKEMVVPLENTSFTSKIAQAMGQAVDNAMARNMNSMYGSYANNSSDSKDIILKVNERELARASINSINKLQRESGRTLLDI